MRIVKASTALGKKLIRVQDGKVHIYDKYTINGQTQNKRLGIDVMMNIVVQMVQVALAFVHIIIFNSHVLGF